MAHLSRSCAAQNNNCQRKGKLIHPKDMLQELCYAFLPLLSISYSYRSASAGRMRDAADDG
jgi:hypothetical protein